MIISSFKISNYKSFLDWQKMSLSPGVNIVVGKNNVGKTALLEALGLEFKAKPHKSLRSMPERTSSPDPISPAEVEISISGQELKKLLLESDEFYVPIEKGIPSTRPELCQNLLESILERGEINFLLGLENGSWTSTRFPSHDLYNCEKPANGRRLALPQFRSLKAQ